MLSALVSGGIGILGVWVGARVAHGSQRELAERDREENRRGLAAALAAELEGYFAIVHRRGHVERAQRIRRQLAIDGVPIGGWLRADEGPLDPFPIAQARMADIGILGPVASDLARLYTWIAGVRTTLIEVERGRFDALAPDGKLELVEEELQVWAEAQAMADQLLPKLRAIATEPKQG
ncbi:hypothetical protein FFK22_009300 [Mycobacterium sp. KBS0706]|uniref:hypothetical protein n=1 Tax=Mycobacterium sp. KBS0706 TaxID=2578109 RepID=UPI00110FA004|nr:hypothetical protein [Mycobacterium sp. KBS0706]TSD88909.1 hypothetical protein FFK22_009300 [Mycobacterium sp. KBS0706]